MKQKVASAWIKARRAAGKTVTRNDLPTVLKTAQVKKVDAPDLVPLELDEAAEGLQVLKIPATRLAEEIGRRIVANVVMLGFVAAVTDIASPEAIKQAVLDSVPKGTEELNTRAFDTGLEYGQKLETKVEAAKPRIKKKAATKKPAKGSAKKTASTKKKTSSTTKKTKPNAKEAKGKDSE